MDKPAGSAWEYRTHPLPKALHRDESWTCSHPCQSQSGRSSHCLHEWGCSHVVLKSETPKWPCPESVPGPLWGWPRDTQSITSCHCSASQLRLKRHLNKGLKSQLNVSGHRKNSGLFSHLPQVVCLPPKKPLVNLIPSE